MSIEIEVDIPAGHEATGEYRPAKNGERFLQDIDGTAHIWHGEGETQCSYIILRQARWRADELDQYYAIASDMSVRPYVDHRDKIDNEAYDAGNYFATYCEAEAVASKFREILAR